MKMRQFKRTKLAMMSYALFGPWLTQPVARTLEGLGEVMSLPTLSQEFPGGPVTIHEDEPTPLVEAFRQGMAEQAAKYVVQRVKDNEIVAEFDTREEALALINKHFKQKKAKLFATQNGEPVMFSEAEFA